MYFHLLLMLLLMLLSSHFIEEEGEERRGEDILSPTKHLVEPFICRVFVWLWDEVASILYPEGTEGEGLVLYW